MSGDDLRSLLKAGEVDPETLVWHARFDRSWKALREAELVDVGPSAPPALPMHAIRNEWAYLLSCFPAWGTILLILLLVGVVKSPLYVPPKPEELGLFWAADIVQLLVLYQLHYVALNVAYLLNIWWVPVLFFVVGNGILAKLDERQTSAAGVRVVGGVVMESLLVPVYLFLRGRAIIRSHPEVGWSPYLPFGLWIVSLTASALLQDPIVARL